MKKFSILSIAILFTLAVFAAPNAVFACGEKGTSAKMTDASSTSKADVSLANSTDKSKACASKASATTAKAKSCDGKATASYANSSDKAEACASKASATTAKAKSCGDKAHKATMTTANADKNCPATSAKATKASMAECHSEYGVKYADNGKSAVATFAVNGMTCGGCEKQVSAKLAGVEGVNDVLVVCHKSNKAMVKFDPKKVDADKLVALVNGLGYEAFLAKADSEDSKDM